MCIRDRDKISYEIRSLDAKRLIANADVTSYTENKGMISMELPIQNLLEENEEYLLVIQLESGDRMIYYYTRIIESQNSYVSEDVYKRQLLLPTQKRQRKYHEDQGSLDQRLEAL